MVPARGQEPFDSICQVCSNVYLSHSSVLHVQITEKSVKISDFFHKSSHIVVLGAIPCIHPRAPLKGCGYDLVGAAMIGSVLCFSLQPARELTGYHTESTTVNNNLI